MSKRKSTIICPSCGAELEYAPHPGKPGREVAYCGCGRTSRAVLERDAVQPVPVEQEDNNG